jgi:hypothetical protein
MTVRFFKVLLAFLLIGLWSSAIFEIGFAHFVKRFGLSLYRLFGILFLGSSLFYAVVVKKGSLSGRSFFQDHKVLFLLYILYWLITYFGVLYSPVAERGLLISLRYSWYTALALFTVFVIFDFSANQRKLLFLLIGVLSLLILSYFSSTTLITGVPVNILAEQEGRFTLSVFSDYNVFTYSLILSICLVFIGTRDAYSNISILKLLLYVVFLLCVMAVGVASGSRRSIMLYGPIAIMTPFFLLGLRSVRRFAWAGIFSILTFGFLTLFVLSLANPEIIGETLLGNLEERALTDLNKRVARGFGFLTGYHRDISTRTHRWDKALNVADEYSLKELLVGRGTRSYFAEPEFVRPDGSRDSPHNFVLAALLEGGVLKLFFLLLFITVWLRHIFLTCLHSSFWFANFLIVSNLLWMTSVLISGTEFFYSKQFLLIFVVYATFWTTSNPTNSVRTSEPSLAISSRMTN